MPTIIQMVELPEFQEVLRLSEDAFPYILDDRENFSHWHLNMTIQIAESIGEPIEFPEDIALNVQAYFEHATAWLEHRLHLQKNTNEQDITKSRSKSRHHRSR